MKLERKELMDTMKKTDNFFVEFGLLDDKAFGDGAISKKHKELFMVAISIVKKCEECISYHLDECKKAEASKEEIVEAIKMGMMSSGSTAYPYVRFAFQMMIEKKII